jgi:tetratricopeptide (TPR) repeat protein
LAESARARELEPLWLAPRAFTGHILYYARRYDEGIPILEQVLALDDRLSSARGFLIRSLIATGDYQRALDEIDKHPLQIQGSNAFRAQALALSGQREAALAELDRVLQLAKQRYVAAYDIAMIYAVLADKERAFQWLDRAIEDRSTPINFLAQDPALDSLHGDPRFAALVQRLGIYGRVLPDS